MMIKILIIGSLLFGTALCQVQPPCTAAPFPKIFGSTSGDTQFLQIDYHHPTLQLLAAGSTGDPLLKGNSNTQQQGIVVLYKGNLMEIQWAKFIEYLNIIISGVCFSPDGTKFVAHSKDSQSRILVCQVSDGSPITSQRIYSNANPSIFGEKTRNMILGLDGNLYVQIWDLNVSRGIIFKILATSYQSSGNWAKSGNAFMVPLGLTFGESESFLYFFWYDSSARKSFLSRIDSSNGNMIWNYQIDAKPGNSQYLEHNVLNTTQSVLIGTVRENSALPNMFA